MLARRARAPHAERRQPMTALAYALGGWCASRFQGKLLKRSLPALCIPTVALSTNLPPPRPFTSSPCLSFSREALLRNKRPSPIRRESCAALFSSVCPAPSSADSPRVSCGNHDRLLQLHCAPFTLYTNNNTYPAGTSCPACPTSTLSFRGSTQRLFHQRALRLPRYRDNTRSPPHSLDQPTLTTTTSSA
jgi:hypothetical protein